MILGQLTIGAHATTYAALICGRYVSRILPKSYTPDGLEELGEGISCHLEMISQVVRLSCFHLEMISQVGVYPREIEELEERIEAGGWDLCIGKDSDQARFK